MQPICETLAHQKQKYVDTDPTKDDTIFCFKIFLGENKYLAGPV